MVSDRPTIGTLVMIGALFTAVSSIGCEPDESTTARSSEETATTDVYDYDVETSTVSTDLMFRGIITVPLRRCPHNYRRVKNGVCREIV